MPYVASGNVKLFFEESGSGYPIIFLHEFDSIRAAGNAQLEAFFSAIEWGSGRRVSLGPALQARSLRRSTCPEFNSLSE
jgi:hypothetical protein